ncbi:hypothetical protein FB567DRAFT_530403 [Paraphoma chrysanthemicola]|uniref:Fungal N-terminal domain-containing protein n=1 Tax=Paraphoma chrysanthemicola TaxID=798071 RepID=A0A8K0VWQ3_9PLEO|nr:hypothetical protein FB567DRAFT_530403 [Paraphoma chrysanthemicola]
MLDPLSTLGLVANVVQFIDFTIKIIAKANDIHQSASGSLVEHDDLSKVTEDITTLSTKLQDSLIVTGTSGCLTNDDQALYDLSKGCFEVSQELIHALHTLQRNGKSSRFRSVRQALKTVWSKDEIKLLERRVGLYKDELNFRIIVRLRTQVDLMAIQQTAGFATLDQNTKTVVQNLVDMDTRMRDGFNEQSKALHNLHSQTDAAIDVCAEENRIDHEQLSNNISDLSEQSIDQSDRILNAQAVTKMAVELSIDHNMAEHEKTRQEMNRLKAEAERQVEVLTEEIRQLKLELEASVKTIVASMGTATKKESQKLKDISNAKFNLWVAKELILEKLKAFIALFRFNFSSELWSAPTDLRSWKLLPYPRPIDGTSLEFAGPTPDPLDADETSMPYSHVDICYPIHALNFPMVKMCLGQGADVNAALPEQFGWGHTPLTKAVEIGCKGMSLYSIPARMAAQRDSRKIVQCLLEHGADPGQMRDRIESGWFFALEVGYHGRADWLFTQLFAHEQHDRFQSLMAMTLAAWNGDLEALKTLLEDEADLCETAERFGTSPLGAAVFREHGDMVHLLLQKGTSPDAIDPIGSTPLAIAVATGSETMAQLLQQHGVSLTIQDPVTRLTPLEWAARHGHKSMCEALLERWKSQGSVDAHMLFASPLTMAVECRHVEVAKLFLDHGANVFIEQSTMEHNTPREHVARRVSSNGVGHCWLSTNERDMITMLEKHKNCRITKRYSRDFWNRIIDDEHVMGDQDDEINANKTTGDKDSNGVNPSGAEHLSVEPSISPAMDYHAKKGRILVLQAEMASSSTSQDLQND